MQKVLGVILMLAFILTGCGQNKVNEKTPEANNNKTEEEKEMGNKSDEVKSQYPMTVKDSHGTEMVIESKPERVLSMTLGTDEMLLAIVGHDKIVALSGSIAEDEGTSNIAEVAKKFDKAEGNIETVISMNPEIVFAADWMAKEKIQSLRDAGIKVYCYGTPSSLDMQKDVITEIAAVVGEKEKGEALVQEMNKKEKAVWDKVSAIKDQDRLRVLAYNSYGSTNGSGTTFDDIVEKAGCINVASEAGLEGWPQVSKEKIIELNPDVIILPAWSYDKNTEPKDLVDQVMNDESLQGISAVQNGRVIMIQDKHMVAVSQNIVLAIEDVAKAVYPELFK